MAKGKLKFRYDRIGDILYDILYINKCPPYAEQESDEIGDEIVARFNPHFGDVENLEVLFFSKRLMSSESLDLPFEVNMRLVS